MEAWEQAAGSVRTRRGVSVTRGHRGSPPGVLVRVLGKDDAGDVTTGLHVFLLKLQRFSDLDIKPVCLLPRFISRQVWI